MAPNPAAVAYHAYKEHGKGLDPITGIALKDWGDLEDEVKQAWWAVAQAMIHYVVAEADEDEIW
jgi:hypothetical protein